MFHGNYFGKPAQKERFLRADFPVPVKFSAQNYFPKTFANELGENLIDDGIGRPPSWVRQEIFMKKYIIIALLAVLGIAATGCKNTAHGMGKDMENAGEKIQDKTN